MSEPNILPSKIEGLISDDVAPETKTLLHMAKEAQETGKIPEIPAVVDPFTAFWDRHPIHEKGLPLEVVASFREFAAGIWNGARFDLGVKQLAAIDKLCSLGLNPEMHPTLEASIEGVTRMVANLRKDLADGPGKEVLVDAVVGTGFKTIEFAKEIESKGLAGFTGNQHNPEWIWYRDKLNELSESDLRSIYESARSANSVPV